MFVRISTLSIVLLNVLFDTSRATIQCQKTLETDKSTLDKCTGDFCVTNIVTTTAGGPAVPMITYGCLTGFDMKLGCFMDSWNNTVCICNDADMCNANLSKNGDKATKVETECYSGIVRDGKLVGNGTCKGQMCLLSYADTISGTQAEIIAGCVYDMIPSYYTGKGCLLFPNIQGGNDTWQCRCQENLCNSPSSFTIPTRSGSVTCGSGFFNANKSLPGPFQNNAGTCKGDFCLLTPMNDPPVVYSKGCISVSNGARVTNKRYKFEVGKSTDIYVCNQDNCNEDVETALKAIGGTSTGGNQPSNTGNDNVSDATPAVEHPANTDAANGNSTANEVSTSAPSHDHVHEGDHVGMVMPMNDNATDVMSVAHVHGDEHNHMEMPMNGSATITNQPVLFVNDSETLQTTIITVNETVLATTVISVNESIVVVPTVGTQNDNTSVTVVPVGNETAPDNTTLTPLKLHDTNATVKAVVATTKAGSTASISSFLIVTVTFLVLKL